MHSAVHIGFKIAEKKVRVHLVFTKDTYDSAAISYLKKSDRLP